MIMTMLKAGPAVAKVIGVKSIGNCEYTRRTLNPICHGKTGLRAASGNSRVEYVTPQPGLAHSDGSGTTVAYELVPFGAWPHTTTQNYSRGGGRLHSCHLGICTV
jgi:hypothetical protein